MADQFAKYDRNGDGVISAQEMEGTLEFSGSSPDRFTPGWDLEMTDAQRQAYIAKVQADNDILTAQWAAARTGASSI